MQKNRKVLAIGAGAEQIFSIKTACNLGLDVIAVDRDKDAPGFAYATQHYAIDIKDVDAVLEVAQKHSIEAVIPACVGRYITSVGYINEKMGLTGPNLNACMSCADKVAFNNMLSANSLNCPRQYRPQETLQIQGTPPLIAKPRYGSGSKNVKLISNQAELTEYLEFYGDTSYLGEPLLEEFIEGTEYGVDAMVINGKVVFLNIRDKVMTPLPYRQELQYISPSSNRTAYDSILTTISHVVNALNITDTMLHADVIIDKKGNPYVIELSPRPAGLNIISKILMANTGRNLIEGWIKYQVWKEPIAPIKMDKIACLQFLPFENMQVTKKPNIDTLIKKYNITDIEFNIISGVYLNKIRDGHDLFERGFFMITDTNYNEIDQRCQNILNDIRSNLYE